MRHEWYEEKVLIERSRLVFKVVEISTAVSSLNKQVRCNNNNNNNNNNENKNINNNNSNILNIIHELYTEHNGNAFNCFSRVQPSPLRIGGTHISGNEKLVRICVSRVKTKQKQTSIFKMADEGKIFCELRSLKYCLLSRRKSIILGNQT